MKKIDVTDEMYEFLMNLSNELNTQDNRATAMPYIFQIETKEQIAVPKGCGSEAWNCDGTLIETEDEIKEAVFEWKEWDEENQDDYDRLKDYEIEEILEVAGWDKVNYDFTNRYQNAFLTAKSCKEHIVSNSHHYTNPVDYLSHAFRNPELEMVMKFLCELTNGKIHK